MKFDLLSPSQIISISRCENLIACLQSFYNLILVIFLALDFLYFLLGAIKYLLETSPINFSPGGRRGKEMMKSALIGLIILFIFPSILQLVNPEIFQENKLIIPVVKVKVKIEDMEAEPEIDEEYLPDSQQSIGTKIKVFFRDAIIAIKAVFTGEDLNISGLDASTFTRNFNKGTDLVLLEQVKGKPFTVKASSPLAKKSLELNGIVLSKKQMRIHYLLVRRLQKAGKEAKDRNKNYILYINSSYRSIEEQKILYEQYQAGRRIKPVARPGRSNHNFGLAVDVNLAVKNPRGRIEILKRKQDWKQLEEIMCQAGFRRFSKESWHFEYGTPAWYKNNGCVFF